MARRRHRLAIIGLLLAGILWGIFHSFQRLDYEWNFEGLGSFFWSESGPGIITIGLWGTISISLVSIVFGTFLGIFVGLLLTSSEVVLRSIAFCFVEVFRNTPVLVQLYVIYFIVGTSFDWSAETSAIVCLSLFSSSYIGEILRAAIIQFDKGQLNAAASLGLTPFQRIRFISGPQILRRVLPSLIGQFVSLVKDSSLVSVISIVELTKSATNVVAATFRSFETWIIIAGIYFVLNFFVSQIGRSVERKFSKDLPST